MNHSQTLENRFAPFDIETIQLFCDCLDIYLFIDVNFPYSRNINILTGDGKIYYFKDSQTFYFHLPEERLYGGSGCALFMFNHSEDEILNKFNRFIKMKAFL